MELDITIILSVAFIIIICVIIIMSSAPRTTRKIVIKKKKTPAPMYGNTVFHMTEEDTKEYFMQTEHISTADEVINGIQNHLMPPIFTNQTEFENYVNGKHYTIKEKHRGLFQLAIDEIEFVKQSKIRNCAKYGEENTDKWNIQTLVDWHNYCLRMDIAFLKATGQPVPYHNPNIYFFINIIGM